MGIFGIFKKKRIEDNENTKKETVNFNELEAFFERKGKELDEKGKDFVALIYEQLNVLREEFSEQIPLLKNLNLNDRKVEERLKILAIENLKSYIYMLEKLNSNLLGIDEKKPKELIKKIDVLFFDFNKKSEVAFQKATILVGKELEKVKEGIHKFFRNLRGLVGENEKIIKDSDLLGFLEITYSETTNLGEIREEVDKKIKTLDLDIKVKEKEFNEASLEVERFKDSAKQKKFLIQSNRIDELNKQIKQRIINLRSFIDFKTLARIFHTNEKKMAVVNEYHRSFYDSFIRDKEIIIRLIQEANLPAEAILKETEDINSLNQELSLINLGVDELGILNEKTANIKKELIELKDSREKEEQILKKNKENFEDKLDFLRAELVKLNAEFVN
jgi:hypothetical protein